jgi:CRISPR/Cas system-associated exonuclease Cas4 (RecB family)
MAKFAHIDNLPEPENAAALFGTCLHSAMEVLINEKDPDKALQVFNTGWKNAEPDKWPLFTSFSNYQKTGEQSVKAVWEKIRWGDRDLIKTEHRFLVPFGDHELEGTVDWIYLRKNKSGKEVLIIEDHKSSSRQPTKMMLRHDIQFTVYDIASQQPEFWFGNGDGFPPIPDADRLWKKVEGIPRIPIWHHLRGPKEIGAGQRNEGDFRRLYRVINEIEKSLDREVFVPNISGSTCSYCSFTDPCGVEVPED